MSQIISSPVDSDNHQHGVCMATATPPPFFPQCTAEELGSLVKLPLEIRRMIYREIMVMPRLVGIKIEVKDAAWKALDAANNVISSRLTGLALQEFENSREVRDEDVIEKDPSPSYADSIKSMCVASKEFAAEWNFQQNRLGFEGSFGIHLSSIPIDVTEKCVEHLEHRRFIPFCDTQDTLVFRDSEAAFRFHTLTWDLHAEVYDGGEASEDYSRSDARMTAYTESLKQAFGVRYIAIRDDDSNLLQVPDCADWGEFYCFHYHAILWELRFAEILWLPAPKVIERQTIQPRLYQNNRSEVPLEDSTSVQRRVRDEIHLRVLGHRWWLRDSMRTPDPNNPYDKAEFPRIVFLTEEEFEEGERLGYLPIPTSQPDVGEPGYYTLE